MQEAVEAMADDARAASRVLATAHRSHKDTALRRMAEGIDAGRSVILEANARDLARGREKGMAENLLDRLALDDARIDALIGALHELAGQTDPVGADHRRADPAQRAAGLPDPGADGRGRRDLRGPPNVTVDIAGLAVKSGNAAMLRGGSAAQETNTALVGILRDALDAAGFPMDAVQSVDEYGRDGATALMLARGRVDVLVPRGGRGLIQSVVATPGCR
ncbi:hypothetical protein A5N15_08125 [Rothia kristinae]|uniref:Glutamate-5-semialdehyde dehydrogenase n=1 Tax=Rothia kristinae TaxID=37923 RepID=A0A657IU71_9MICC|nr:hypothetical protein A5N15_08125 [Rothia kristinae]